MKYDVFISHAWEDKEDIARPLAEALIQAGLRVWYDEFSLTLGDSLRRSIDRGLAESRYGVVILSPHFFAKEWPKRELDALASREVSSGRVLLPVWHNISAQEVAHFSPVLADRLAVSTDQGISAVVKAIAGAVLIKAQGESQSIEKRLESVIERLERLERFAIPQTGVTATVEAYGIEADDVFVVHGHDEAIRESVCRFLEKVGARPVVLSEQPNRGMTVIEKFENYSDVKFAVVLLTPDDFGGLRSSPDEISFRARQNVILELGYFLGKLGRKRFCILNKGGVEIPSDIHGVVWIEMDPAHGWRISLARELKQAGVRINLNRVLE